MRPLKPPTGASAPRRGLVTRTHSPKTNTSPLQTFPTSHTSSPSSMVLGTPTSAAPEPLSLQPPNSSVPRAKLLPPTLAGVIEAASRLRNGQLLAFPTETVYGLGANALMESSVMEIFKVKGRPLTDPLIIHVPSAQAALDCLEFPASSAAEPSEGRAMFDRLTGVFWPGALTIVAKAKPHIPLKVSANTGYVGLRCPSHPLAIRVLESAGVPVAAPSANRFGHVSPTRASHVMSDLGSSDIAIMNGEDKREIFAVPPCQFGIESTVVKISESDRELIVLRRGAITQSQLEAAVLGNAEKGKEAAWKVVVVNTHDAMTPPPAEERKTKRRKVEPSSNGVGEGAGHIAPGQLLTHYAPDGMECYLVRPSSLVSPLLSSVNSSQTLTADGATAGGAVVIDYKGTLAGLGLGSSSPGVIQYRDLSPTGSPAEAASNLFAYLRWCEAFVGDVSKVLLCDVAAVGKGADEVQGVGDRMFRSASGKVMVLSSV